MIDPEMDVNRVEPGTWRVVVRAARATTHTVTIPAGYLDELGFGKVAEDVVVRESFRFLLEREPNTSILSQFALPMIGRYFPEYGREIVRRVAP